MGSSKVFSWLLVIVASTTLFLAVTDFVLVEGNRSLQEDVADRQHAIAQGPQLNRLMQALVRDLTVAAVHEDDRQIRDLLTKHGIAAPAGTDRGGNPGAGPGAPGDSGFGTAPGGADGAR